MGSIIPLLRAYANNPYSDARSAQIVDDRIRPALESGSKVGSNKPTLLVVDEIDGATGGSDTVRSIGALVAHSQLNVQ